MERDFIGPCVVFGVLSLVPVQGETLLPPAFTYQGQLKQAGRPTDGLADLKFSLWTAVAGPSQIGPTLTFANLDVDHGLFSVALDFGAGRFNGDPRWLQVEARHPASVGVYTTLTPRQPVTAAPYALHTRGVYVAADGKVGIGDTSPAAMLTVGDGDKLQVSGSDGDVIFTDDQASITFPAADATNAPMMHMFASGVNNGTRMVIAHSPSNTQYGLQYEDISDTFRFLGGGIHRMAIGLFNGQVSIGTGESTHRLTIGSNTSDTLRLIGPGSQGEAARLNFGDANFAYIEEDVDDSIRIHADAQYGGRIALTGGNVGVGTTSPGAKFEVLQTGGGIGVFARSNGAGLNGPAVRADNTNASGIGIFSTTASSDSNLVLTNTGSGDLIRGFSGPGGSVFAFRVENNGKTTVPVLTITGGSDLAEPFNVSTLEHEPNTEPRPGMVVVIDPDQPGKLKLSMQSYDRKVAGVISGANGLAPGMVMSAVGNPHVDGDHPVALTGRVWCRCDASHGPIRPGDLLTTADSPGHAMKVSDHAKAQGAILGKAMSSLDQGTGLVLVLVTLQ